MERQLERKREAEPVVFSRMIEEMWTRLKTLNETVAAMPHVIKYNDVPWNQNATTYLKNYTGPAGIPGWLSKVPIHTLDLREQMVFAGRKSGKHRHYQEAFFYIIEGEGYEIHDDKKYPWEAGDVMCVPTYCIHQHFNTGNQNARLFFNLPNVFDLMGLSSIEQIEIHERYQPPEGATVVRNAEGNVIGYKTASGEELRFGAVDLDYMKMMEGRKGKGFVGEPQNTYQHYRKTLQDTITWRLNIPHVIKGKDKLWENTEMGKLKFLISPYNPGPLLLYDAYLQELPPGGKSGKHRHVGEEVHKILSGKGYDIHDGKKWDWDTEDVVIIPNNTVHQHFNADPRHTATFLSLHSRLYHYIGHGGIEHLEDATK